MGQKRAQKVARRQARREQKVAQGRAWRARHDEQDALLLARARGALTDPAQVSALAGRLAALLEGRALRRVRVPIEDLARALVACQEAGDETFPRGVVDRLEPRRFDPDFVRSFVAAACDRGQPEEDRLALFFAALALDGDRRGGPAADAVWDAVLRRSIERSAPHLFAELGRAVPVERDELRAAFEEARRAGRLAADADPVRLADELHDAVSADSIELDYAEAVGSLPGLVAAARDFAAAHAGELSTRGLTPALRAAVTSGFDQALALDAATTADGLRATLQGDLDNVEEELGEVATTDDGGAAGELEALRSELTAFLASLAALPPARNPFVRALYGRLLAFALDDEVDGADGVASPGLPPGPW